MYAFYIMQFIKHLSIFITFQFPWLVELIHEQDNHPIPRKCLRMFSFLFLKTKYEMQLPWNDIKCNEIGYTCANIQCIINSLNKIMYNSDNVHNFYIP